MNEEEIEIPKKKKLKSIKAISIAIKPPKKKKIRVYKSHEVRIDSLELDDHEPA